MISDVIIISISLHQGLDFFEGSVSSIGTRHGESHWPKRLFVDWYQTRGRVRDRRVCFDVSRKPESRVKV